MPVTAASRYTLTIHRYVTTLFKDDMAEKKKKNQAVRVGEAGAVLHPNSHCDEGY